MSVFLYDARYCSVYFMLFECFYLYLCSYLFVFVPVFCCLKHFLIGRVSALSLFPSNILPVLLLPLHLACLHGSAGL